MCCGVVLNHPTGNQEPEHSNFPGMILNICITPFGVTLFNGFNHLV